MGPVIGSARGVMLIVLIVLVAILTIPLETTSEPVRRQGVNTQLRGEFIQLRKMIEDRRREGVDVSGAMEIGRRAREAAMSGDREKAMKLIDQAIALVDGSKSDRAEEPGKVVEHKRGTRKTVELKVNSSEVTITSSVAGFRYGKEVSNVKGAFPTEVVKVIGGKVRVGISSIPIFIEESLPGADASAFDNKDASLNSPFGGHPTAMVGHLDEHYKDIGVKWMRYPGRFMAWDIIERKKGEFNWSISDTLVSETYENGINIVLTVRSFNRWDQPAKKFEKGKLMKPKAPSDLQAFMRFLTKAVERYDGDGIDDAPGSPVVNYWQIENEVDGNFWGDTPETYAKLLKASYKAVKKANPNAKVLIAGASIVQGFYRFYIPILEELRNVRDNSGDRYFDIFDIHWYGKAGEYKQIEGKSLIEFIEDLRNTLADYGYSNIPIWITETGTYGGKRVVAKSGELLPRQDEAAQAAELVKRYIYFISNGIRKIFWSQMVEKHHVAFGGKNDYFENVGLINNPRNDGDSSKKLAYFSYKFLVEKLEGSKWERIERIDLGREIYAYRLTQNGTRIYIIWHGEVE